MTLDIIDFTNALEVVPFFMATILILGLAAFLVYIGRHFSLRGAIITFSVLGTISILSLLFQIWIVLAIVLLVLVASGLVIFMAFFTKNSLNSLLGLRIRRTTNRRISKVFSKEALYDEITEAVVSLSKKKIGALITFERSTPLDEYLVNGVQMDSPVSHQLLGTIFYPGTPLHDGAVIVRKNVIIAASVYFSPTTKPMKGKLGSRHRAAIGISEVSDAITIVVSEETGRISITQNGEMEEIHIDEVYRSLEDYLG